MLKISLPGKDVNTASPEDLAVDSTYDSLKIKVTNSNPYTGEILVTFKSNPAAGTYNIFTYNHGFDYVPVFYFYYDVAKSISSNVNTSTGFETAMAFGLDVAFDQQFKVTKTSTGFSFDYINGGVFGGNQTNKYYSFRYFVYVNDGT